MTAAALGTSAPHTEELPNEPTLEVVVDAAAMNVEVAACDVAATELDAPVPKPSIRSGRWLIACAGMLMLAFALTTWLFVTSTSRVPAPRTAQTRSANGTDKPRATLQETQVGPRVVPASSSQPGSVTAAASAPAPAPERPAPTIAVRSAQPQAGGVPRTKPAAIRTQDTKAHKPAPKLFIPADI